MSYIVDRKDRYISNMPVVGVTPNVYSFNNIGSILDPYMGVNEVQFYNPLTGQLGPNYKTSSFQDNMLTNQPNNNQPNMLTNQLTSLYNDNGINVQITGSQDDTKRVITILNNYFTKTQAQAQVQPQAQAQVQPQPQAQ